MKGIFIVYGQHCVNDNTGIGLKIRNQIKAFQQSGIDFSEYMLPYGKSPFLRILYRLPFYNGYPIWRYEKKMAEADCIYLRRPFVMTGYMRKVLRQIKRGNPDIKIVLEIPTYPYDKELEHFKLGWLFLIRDKYNRKRLKGCIDRIAVLTRDEEIFGLPTIRIKNGIDVAIIVPRLSADKKDEAIHLCAVALFKEWHGYERLLYGMADYYKMGGNKNIVLHFVGTGQEVSLYKKIVKQKKLEQHVIFHGHVTGEQLDKLYNEFDIGICSLGVHRKGIYEFSSELKSREYLAKGLPIIASTVIDVFEGQDYPYCLYVPGDESPICIDRIIEFYHRIYRKKTTKEVNEEIRQYALDHVDMKKTMKPVVDYIKST